MSSCHQSGFTLGENESEQSTLQPKRRCFQRRKFRSKKRKERWNTSCHRIDLKDWPSDVPLPSTNPSSLRLHEELFTPTACDSKQVTYRCSRHHHHSQGIYTSDWKTPWDLSLDESGESTTDVGFTTSTVSALSWDYDDLGSDSIKAAVLTSDASSGSSEVFTPATNSGSRQRNIIICEDRLTTWRREESSPTFFLLALITVLLLTGFLSSSAEALFKPQQHNESTSRQSDIHVPITAQVPDNYMSLPACSLLYTKATGSYTSQNILDFHKTTPLLPLLPRSNTQDTATPMLNNDDDVDDDGGSPNTTRASFHAGISASNPASTQSIVEEGERTSQPALAGKMQWTTYGVDRCKTTPLRLTVFSVGAAVSLYAWQWF